MTDEIEEPTEEEMALAKELNDQWDKEHELSKPASQAAVALLQTADSWEPSSAPLQRIRSDVIEMAEKAAAKKSQDERSRQRFPRWLAWLPLPAAALMMLWFVGQSADLAETSEVASSHEITTPPSVARLEEEDSRRDSEDTAEENSLIRADKARWHTGETPHALLEAQAKLLAAKSEKKPFDRSGFDEEMRNYRAQLVARLEMEGRR